MDHSRKLRLKPFNSLCVDHEQIIVPAFQDIPVCETRSMQRLRRLLNLRRKTIERIRTAQNPGSIFYVKAARNKILACLLLANNPAELTYKSLFNQLQNALQHHDEKDAILGDGFQVLDPGHNEDQVYYGFSLLCKALRKLGFLGTVYEPPEYSLQFHSSEITTGTHGIIRPDGSVTPSVPPTLLKLSLSKKK